MPTYSVKLLPQFEEKLAMWVDVPIDVTRRMFESCQDTLEHRTAFDALRRVTDGHVLEINVDGYSFRLFVQHRDETFFIRDGDVVRP